MFKISDKIDSNEIHSRNKIYYSELNLNDREKTALFEDT